MPDEQCVNEHWFTDAPVLQTVADLASGGCDVVVPFVLLIGLAETAYATRIWWKSATCSYEALQSLQSPPEA